MAQLAIGHGSKLYVIQDGFHEVFPRCICRLFRLEKEQNDNWNRCRSGNEYLNYKLNWEIE